jgi:hypothetical protein
MAAPIEPDPSHIEAAQHSKTLPSATSGPTPKRFGGDLRPDIHSVVAEIDGSLVGSNFLWENGTIAGIGPITVGPKVQNGRVGKQLP